MTVPRSVFQYTAEYVTSHEPKKEECFCYSCNEQFWHMVWVYSTYNGLRLKRRHLLCSYRKNILTYEQAKKLNPDAPSLAKLEAIKTEGPVFIPIDSSVHIQKKHKEKNAIS